MKRRTTKIVIFTLILFIISQGIASATSITLSPEDGHSNQDQITEALEDYDEVYLSAGVYEVDGKITILEGKELTGDPDAIIRVWQWSSLWFIRNTGIITGVGTSHVKIHGFQIDGNCGKLPASYANYAFTGGSGHHNTEKAIVISGSTNNFISDISIYEMEIIDCFSDGIRVYCADDVQIYNNFISNCQHEGVYFVCVRSGIVQANEIAGITSDCVRFDNCQNSKICENYLFSYNGTSNNGATEGRHQGVQISDQGRSFNSGSDQPLHTTNIEVCNNVFAGDKRMNCWIDSAGKGVENVFIHDNQFLDGKAVETSGISVDGLSIGDVDFDHIPSKEMSKQVFSSIYELLGIENSEFVDTGITGQTADDINYEVEYTETGKIAWYLEIIGWKNLVVYNGTEYVSSPDDLMYKSSVIRSPSLDMWSGGIKDIKKEYNIVSENGETILLMNVTATWYNIKTNPITGKSEKSKLKTNNYHFKRAGPSKDIWPEILDETCNATEFRGKLKNYTLVSGPSDRLVKLVFRYNGTVTTHYFMMGEKLTDPSTGIQYTKFEDVNYWEGDLPHYGDTLYINGTFDPEKLKVEAYSPYNSTSLKIEHTIKDKSETAFADGLFEFIVKTLVYLFGIDRLIRILKN